MPLHAPRRVLLLSAVATTATATLTGCFRTASPDGGPFWAGVALVPLDGAVGKGSAPLDGGDAAPEFFGDVAQPIDGGDAAPEFFGDVAQPIDGGEAP